MKWIRRQVEAARAERVARQLLADRVIGGPVAAARLREAARLLRSRQPEDQAAGRVMWRG